MKVIQRSPRIRFEPDKDEYFLRMIRQRGVREIARRVGRSPTWISLVLNGRATLPYESALEIARAIDDEFPVPGACCWLVKRV